MNEILKALIFSTAISTVLLFDFTPRALPVHPIYTAYTYSFTKQEKQEIQKLSSFFKGDFKNHYWPTNLKNNKLNNFFKILNLKDGSTQYHRALRFLLILSPDSIYYITKNC